MDLIERLEDEGRIVVIRPVRPVEVSRMEKDTKKIGFPIPGRIQGSRKNLGW